MREVLFAGPHGSASQHVHEFRERLNSRFKTLRIQRKRRFVRRNLDLALLENASTVDPVADEVPRYAMPGFTVQNRPRGRVNTGVARERSVVEIDCAPARQSHDFLREELHVGNAEQIIERPLFQNGSHIARRVHQSHASRLRPSANVGVLRDDPANLVVRIEEEIAALNCQRLFAENETTDFHMRTTCSASGEPAVKFPMEDRVISEPSKLLKRISRSLRRRNRTPCPSIAICSSVRHQPELPRFSARC